MIKISNDWKIENLSFVSNQPLCHANSTHLSQNARVNSSAVNLDSGKKRTPKHK